MMPARPVTSWPITASASSPVEQARRQIPDPRARSRRRRQARRSAWRAEGSGIGGRRGAACGRRRLAKSGSCRAYGLSLCASARDESLNWPQRRPARRSQQERRPTMNRLASFTLAAAGASSRCRPSPSSPRPKTPSSTARARCSSRASTSAASAPWPTAACPYDAAAAAANAEMVADDVQAALARFRRRHRRRQGQAGDLEGAGQVQGAQRQAGGRDRQAAVAAKAGNLDALKAAMARWATPASPATTPSGASSSARLRTSCSRPPAGAQRRRSRFRGVSEGAAPLAERLRPRPAAFRSACAARRSRVRPRSA